MRKLTYSLAVPVLLVLVVGCAKTTVEGTKGEKLTVMRPTDQTVKQGETNQVSIIINRDNFRDAVEVVFDKLPPGITVTDKDMTIAADKNKATFTLKAEPNAAPVSNHKVTLIVKGPSGMKVEEKFQLTIKEKS